MFILRTEKRGGDYQDKGKLFKGRMIILRTEKRGGDYQDEAKSDQEYISNEYSDDVSDIYPSYENENETGPTVANDQSFTTGVAQGGQVTITTLATTPTTVAPPSPTLSLIHISEPTRPY